MCINIEVLTTIVVLQWSIDTGEAILVNGELVHVVELSPLCAMGIPQYKDADGRIVSLKASDDVRIPQG